jgi:hypothetical protein
MKKTDPIENYYSDLILLLVFIFPVIPVVVAYELLRSKLHWYVLIPALFVSYFVAMGLGGIILVAIDRVIGFLIGGKRLGEILNERQEKEVLEKSEQDEKIEKRLRFMVKLHRAVIWLIAIGGVLYCCFGNLSQETTIGIAVVAGAFILVRFLQLDIDAEVGRLDKELHFMDERFRGIENRLGLSHGDNMEEKLQLPISYEIYLILIPHWAKIFEEFSKRCKYSLEVFEKVYEDKQLDIKHSKALWRKEFSFRIFNNEISGMKQIWSDHHKTFIDKIVASGDVFDPSHQLPDMINLKHEYISHEIPTGIECTPEKLSLKGGPPFHSGSLAQIPYGRIQRLLLNLGKYSDGAAGCAIKQFPPGLKREMDENNVQYDNEPWIHIRENDNAQADKDFDKIDHHLNNEGWLKKEGIQLYQQKINWHAFHTPYYTVSVRFNFFPILMSRF